jgi:hypothetical protein
MGEDVMSEEAFTWFVGVDWGSEKHQVCVLDQHGTVAGERSFPHGGAGLAELGDWLLSITGAANTIAVAIEVPHGPVVDSLIDRGFAVYTINPKQLDRLRDRFSVPGRRTIVGTVIPWRMAYAPTGGYSAAFMLLTRGWLSCGHGRGLPGAH